MAIIKNLLCDIGTLCLSPTLQPHEFDSLPAGFEYEHKISEASEASNTIAFGRRVDERDLRRCARGRQEDHIQA